MQHHRQSAARKLMEQLIQQESVLFGKRRALVLQHTNEAGLREEATLGMLSTNLPPIRANRARKSLSRSTSCPWSIGF